MVPTVTWEHPIVSVPDPTSPVLPYTKPRGVTLRGEKGPGINPSVPTVPTRVSRRRGRDTVVPTPVSYTRTRQSLPTTSTYRLGTSSRRPVCENPVSVPDVRPSDVL